MRETINIAIKYLPAQSFGKNFYIAPLALLFKE